MLSTKTKGMIVSATEAFVGDRANCQMREGLCPLTSNDFIFLQSIGALWECGRRLDIWRKITISHSFGPKVTETQSLVIGFTLCVRRR